MPPTITYRDLALNAPTHVIGAARRLPTDTESPELEVRFGGRSSADSTFEAGVSLSFFQECISACDAFRGWKEMVDWTATTEFYYNHEGRTIRTTRDSAGGVRHMSKVPVTRCELCMEHSRPMAPAMLRIGLSMEGDVETGSLPSTVLPTRIREKTRKSYVHGSFRWDFTRVYQGATRAEVDLAIAEERPVYEVEVELHDLTSYCAHHDDRYVAESLLMKIIDLIDTKDVSVG